jgi:lipopolysaccharide export system permease protein
MMRLFDLYLLRRTFKPLSASLIVVLAALLLERSLRLFSLIVERGSPVTLVVEMAANLVPHYLGLALPAAFFISMQLVISRMDEENELDAMRNTGLSLRRVCLPFFATALALAAFGLMLYGYLQPYSRYDYRASFHIVSIGPWDATLQEGVFLTRDDGFTISADAVDPGGRRLAGVVVHQVVGRDTLVTTAPTGRLDLSRDGRRAILTLYDGVQLRNYDGGARASLLTFSALTIDRDLNPDVLPFRPRGGDEREMTLRELYQELRSPAGEIAQTRISSELHARLARSASMLILPLIAVPLGLAAKRSRRGHGVAIALIILLTYHHLLVFAEGLADTGRVAAPLGLWTPVAVLALLGAWAFRRVDVRPDGNPLKSLIETAEAAVQAVGAPHLRRAGARR